MFSHSSQNFQAHITALLVSCKGENEKCSVTKVFPSVQMCRLYQVSEVGQSLKKEDGGIILVYSNV